MRKSQRGPWHVSNPIAVVVWPAALLLGGCGSSGAGGKSGLDASGAGGLSGSGGATQPGTGGRGVGGSPGTGGTAGRSGAGSSASGGNPGSGGIEGGGGAAGAGGLRGSGGQTGAGGANVLDGGADVAVGCPAQLPVSGGACQASQLCTYGQSSCCGRSYSAWTCACQGGNFSCSQTVECNIVCPVPDGAVAFEVSMDTSHDGGGSALDASGVGAACGSATDPACAGDTYCQWSDNLCGGRTHGACTGIPRGVLCAIPAAPVCGCDGKNYPSECDAAKAGMDVSSSATCPEPAGMFRCGWSYCQHNVAYCSAQVGGAVSNPGSYACPTLPAACGGVSSCTCVTGSSTCTANAQGDVTVTQYVP